MNGYVLSQMMKSESARAAHMNAIAAHPKPEPLIGTTALMIASQEGHTEVCELLIENGALITPKNSKGHTALFLACIGNHKDIVKLLLAAGADKNALDNEGKKAIELTNSVEIQTLLS